MSRLDRHTAALVACTQCPRLANHRVAVIGTKRAFRGQKYWANPVPGFGDTNARVVAVGLAPAAHGANRTGRMFTGDGTDGMGSSDFLMRALHATGFANQATSRAADDGLVLTNLWLTAVLRCAPPDNRPAPQEIANCSAWLGRELELLLRARVIVALGRLAFDRTLLHYADAGARVPRPRPLFAHGVEVPLGGRFPLVLASYHPSRQNTQTGRLTADLLEAVLRRARDAAT